MQIKEMKSSQTLADLIKRKSDDGRKKDGKARRTTMSAHCEKGTHRSCTAVDCECTCGHGIEG